MKTTSVKPSDIKKNWYIVDATNKTLGRLSSEIARVLRGKHKPTFTPHLDCGDHVVVVNADKIHLTGQKWSSKVYYHHSGFIGGIKSTRAEEMLKKHPERLIQIAVKGMLPKNKLAKKIINHLKVYAGPEHPHTAQQPQPLPERTAVKN